MCQRASDRLDSSVHRARASGDWKRGRRSCLRCSTIQTRAPVSLNSGRRYRRGLTTSLKAACKPAPNAFPTKLVSLNMSFRRPSKDSMPALASVRLTRRSVGEGRNTSSKSPTTSIVGSVASGYMRFEQPEYVILSHKEVHTVREKKCKAVSNPMMHIFVLLSSLGRRSKDSKRVRAAVATMPVYNHSVAPISALKQFVDLNVLRHS